MIALIFAAVISVQPPAPKVGDLITVEFRAAPVSLERTADYEVVSQSGKRVVVRTFAPKPFVLRGTAGGVRFSDVRIPVQSVLKPNDNLTPAPLAPPRPVPYPRAPFVAIGIAALCAICAWLAVWWRARKPVEIAMPIVSPDERFRRAVLALRNNASHPRRWAMLADETRVFLAATRPRLGSELTTTEMLPRLAEGERVVEEILRQGDLEKFSPRGARGEDFEEVAERAMRLAS